MAVHTQSRHRSQIRFDHAVALVRRICELAGDHGLLRQIRNDLNQAGLVDAVRLHNDNALFEWLMESVSYQGVSDAIALDYMDRHGRIAAPFVKTGLVMARCPKLTSYWHFEGCGYRKSANTCAMPHLIQACPVPRHDLRNGRLNRTAYSIFLFFRDVANGDFVSWIDARLKEADRIEGSQRAERLATAIVEPMAQIHGVSKKLITMSMSSLLLGSAWHRERWRSAGAVMIAVDTLVHNWLHRTGIMRDLNRRHLYGLPCYGPNGCAETIRTISEEIDASAFNASFPQYFPRFVQHAVWRFCSQSGLNQCNGNKIDDHRRCQRIECALFRDCGRVVLNPIR